MSGAVNFSFDKYRIEPTVQPSFTAGVDPASPAGMTFERLAAIAELKGDTASRANWYRTMSELSVFSPDDIAALEDLPNVPGGDRRRASLNYVPLDLWPELSAQRNGGGAAGKE